MRLLLDTHGFLWFIGGDQQLSERARQAIEDENNEVWLSIGSLWEIVIKLSSGKLSLGKSFEQLIPGQIEDNSIDVLGVDLAHLAVLLHLPIHHRDPFDRLIIAQGISEGMVVVSKDDRFPLYPVEVLW